MSIKRSTIVFNQTTNEWIITNNEKDYWKKMKYLLSKNKKCETSMIEGALLDTDCKESRWKRTDKIVLMDLNNKNRKYFQMTNSKINISNDESVFIIDLTI